MKYLVLGAGGTGGCIAAYLAEGGMDVTMIARGAHLEAMRANGFLVKGTRMGDLCLREDKLKLATTEDYEEKADVILLCVKSYSVEELVPFMRKATHEKSLIIPILNVVNTGEVLAKWLPERTVLSGCIYIASYISAPGVVEQLTPSFRVVYGDREGTADKEMMEAVAQDMRSCNMDIVVAENIAQAAFDKFLFLSPYAAAGAYLDVLSSEFQKEGEARDLFVALLKEVVGISKALGYDYGKDMVAAKTDHLKVLNPTSTASMVKDVKKGGKSEIDGLVFEVVRMGRKLGVPCPNYEKVAAHFGYTL
ncbi:2-dehydropantoate 2-reductase [Anaerolentibacter hominis]|uniref:ketopantoate reductase family protein n=1 Tax=Anaerolentibacter hominis TaxID=3079009 RepID=UPI0031B89EBB